MHIQRIGFKNLYFAYQQKLVFESLSFECMAGSLVGLMGPNGRGKTTFLKLLAQLIHPETPSLIINGSDKSDVLETYQEHVHYLGHQPALNSNLTLLENLRYDSLIFNQTLPLNVTELMKKWSLFDQLNTLVKDLSFGQQRKIGLIRLACFPSQVWLLDEPFTGLDPSTCLLLKDLIQRHVEDEGIVVLSSHQDITQYGLAVNQLIQL